MKLSHMKIQPILWLCALAGAFAPASAIEWEILRFDGRDYVTLESFAAHYTFPTPPALVPSLDPLAPPPTIELKSESSSFTATPGDRVVEINGARQWLAFPVRVEDGRVLLSRLDLSKIIEPRLRPERIDGLQPVTTIVLDPGHGGHDKGAVSRWGYEKDFALDVALRMRPLLEKQGYKVVLTRGSDIFIPLHDRPAVANGIPDSIFVSIHFNASSTNANARGFEIFSIAPRGAPATNDGTEVHLRDLREEPGNALELPSSALAGTLFHALLGHVPMVDRGIKHARFAVLRLCERPAVLVECGFVSNSAESALIGSGIWRAQVAEAIVDGVENYKALAERKLRPKTVADYRNATAPTQ